MRRWMASVVLVSACGGGGAQPETAATENATPADDTPATSESNSEASPAAAEASAAESRIAPPQKGTAAAETRSIHMDFELTLHRGDSPAGLQSGTWSVEEQRSMQVREVGPRAIRVMSVVFGKRIAGPLLGIEKKPVTAGKKFLVTAKDGGAKVEYLDGGTAPAEERDAVLGEFGYVGAPSLLARIVSANPVAGKKTSLDLRQALAVLGEVPGLDLDATKVTLTFEALRDGSRKSAAFKVEVKSRIVSGPTHFAFDLTGPLEVDLHSGWIKHLELDGAVQPGGQVKTKKGMLGVKGKGTIRIERKTTF
ncbi:MAG: hypothetical protein R3B13_36020 [Polyangiaceae bacterium]